MLLREEDSGVFKDWLLPKLDTISDADAEVLADYVIALVTGHESEETVRQNCLESLADFLQDNTRSFVDDIFKVLKTKSYASALPASSTANNTRPQTTSIQQQPQHIKASQAAPIPSIVGISNAEYEPHPSHSSNAPPSHAPKGPAATRVSKAQHRLPDRPTGPSSAQSNTQGVNTEQSSRKRKLIHRDASETRDGQDSHYNRTGGGGRPIKQTARRGGKNLRGGAAAFEPQNAFSAFASMPNMLSMADLPPPPPGPLPFDMSNPMAFFAMMAALGGTMPGMPALPLANSRGKGTNGQTRTAKCQDYHTKGFCALGTMCPFEHGDANDSSEDVPEYDPDHPSLGARVVPSSNGRQGANRRYNNLKGGRPRAPFSLPGPSHDRTNTTLIVEQIPEENFNEDSIRNFFSQFGTITEVQMRAYKRLSIVRFEDHASANQAYNSPKAVFENRFVKVYWYKHDSSTGNIDMADDEHTYHDDTEVLDPEEIERRQAEAQKAFEERRRKVEEAEARAADIERQLREKDAEMKKIRQQLAELAGDESNDDLSQDLATLQAEAESLFAQNDHTPHSSRGRDYPPRGAYRGRGFAPFPPRGRGAYRGAYRGRGAFPTPFAGSKSSVKRLDNRPRRLAVAGIEKGTQKDEALRQYLVNMPECSSIEPHPEQPNTLVLTFQERFQAEMFLDNSRKIPDTGPLELSWISNDALGGLKSTTVTNAARLETDASDDDSSATVGEEEPSGDAEDSRQAADADMDVADDVDQWL